jgi:hypothetical protein
MSSLFSSGKQVGFFDMISQPTAGRLVSKVPFAANFKTIYVGISSANELYDQIKSQLESSFEVRAVYVNATSFESTDYLFDQGSTRGIIQIQYEDSEDGGRSSRGRSELVIKWSQIIERASSRMGSFSPVSSERVSYQIYGAGNESSALYMNS